MANNLSSTLYSEGPVHVGVRCSNRVLIEKLKSPPLLRDLVASDLRTAKDSKFSASGSNTSTQEVWLPAVC